MRHCKLPLATKRVGISKSSFQNIALSFGLYKLDFLTNVHRYYINPSHAELCTLYAFNLHTLYLTQMSPNFSSISTVVDLLCDVDICPFGRIGSWPMIFSSCNTANQLKRSNPLRGTPRGSFGTHKHAMIPKSKRLMLTIIIGRVSMPVLDNVRDG